jgi:hypothetical protein
MPNDLPRIPPGLRARPRVPSRRRGAIAYREPAHEDLPHVVKFSGGRSSGMLLFTLLDKGLLDRSRGDVIVFNNTSAEHPETYRFVEACASSAQPYGVPFFRIEFQTYEDIHRGDWTRLPAYRLVNAAPRSASNPDGFHWRGSVYEELLSWSGYVPNQFRRTCTSRLKLEPTRRFVQDWLRGRDGIPRLGHHGKVSRIDPKARFRIHRKHNGQTPEDVFRRRHAYCWNRPHVRPEQRYADFSPRWTRLSNADGPKTEHVTLIGLRGDEHRRVDRIRTRGGHDTEHEGEHVYMPLDSMDIDREKVNAFWSRRDWDLRLPADAGLSNCVYCFLKGGRNLQSVHRRMKPQSGTSWPGFGPLAGTPCDLDWWIRMETEYGRERTAGNDRAREQRYRLAFFGARKTSYADLEESRRTGKPVRMPAARDCTE